MPTATLLTTVEAKSRVISHERLLTVLAADDIAVRSIMRENNDSLMRITVESIHDMPLHPHFTGDTTGPRTGMQFLGLGYLPSDDAMRVWLHQWLMLSMHSQDVQEGYGTETISSEDVLEQIRIHQEELCTWLETSRGW